MWAVPLFCKNRRCINSHALYALSWFAKTSKTERHEINVDIFLRLHYILFLPPGQGVIYQGIFSVVVSTLDWLVLLEKDHYCHIISCFPVRCIEMFIFCSACRCTLKFKRVIMSFNRCRRTNKYMFLFFCPFICQRAIKFPKMCFFLIYSLVINNEQRLQKLNYCHCADKSVRLKSRRGPRFPLKTPQTPHPHPTPLAVVRGESVRVRVWLSPCPHPHTAFPCQENCPTQTTCTPLSA